MNRLVLLGGVSGCVWGALGYWVFSDTGARSAAWAGLVASPGIGVLIGILADRARPLATMSRIAYSFLGLYMAVAMFGGAVGLAELSSDGKVQIGPLLATNPLDVVVHSAAITLIGLTMSGWFLILWPLSFANHVMIWVSASLEWESNRRT